MVLAAWSAADLILGRVCLEDVREGGFVWDRYVVVRIMDWRISRRR